jgi:hypothetical protein
MGKKEKAQLIKELMEKKAIIETQLKDIETKLRKLLNQ